MRLDPPRREIRAQLVFFAQFLVRGVAAIDWRAVDSLTAQKRLIEAGFGVALIPERSMREERAQKTLCTIRVSARCEKSHHPAARLSERGGDEDARALEAKL